MSPQAVIFDLDGLLIDTEAMWDETEQRIFAAVGLDCATFDPSCTVGLRVDEAIRYWYERHPWNGTSPQEVERMIVDEMAVAIATRARALDGASHALEVASELGVPLAVASSSPSRLIDASFRRLGISHLFDLAVSAENERCGKPDPSVYLTTARQLDVAPQRCVALEDSPNGVRAAKAAGMYCIAVPTETHRPVVALLADLVLPSLDELTLGHLSEGPTRTGARGASAR